MKRIFCNYPITTNIAEVFHYDYSEGISRCMENINGVFHSINIPVELNKKYKRYTIAVPGWDLSNDNILSLPFKICECVVRLIEDDYYIAYTYWFDMSLILNIVKVNQRIWLSPGINAFDYACKILTLKDGINSRLQFDGGKFFWRMYKSAVASASYKIYSYDFRQKSIIQLTEVSMPNKQDNPRQLLIEQGRAHFVYLRRSGIYCIHIYPKKQDVKAPTIVICPGGPYIKIPDIRFLPRLYHRFSEEGYHVIIPLRKGVIGLSSEWEKALSGNYGIVDVEDILASTREFVTEFKSIIDYNRLGLYGASFVNYWEVPTLLVHTIDDTTTWFGQSVGAYNAVLNNARCNISLILTEGYHSYDNSNEEAIEEAIINHFNKTLKSRMH